ncbi:MAG: butyrate kinase [Clostridiaceae bacterium]|jgi:butyrate kinase|nr:butyrate kinase [Clostridiaceae bacterium]
MSYHILAINPGSTTTKIAYYQDSRMQWVKNIEHDQSDLAPFKTIYDQYHMRRQLVLDTMAEQGTSTAVLSAVVARGGLLPPVEAGAYHVNQAMMDTLRYRPANEHASNLGAVLAWSIAEPLGIPSFIYDPVTVDELEDIAQITGLKEMRRVGMGHNLNMRAAAIKFADSQNRPYEELNILVAHLGGGITLSLHSGGRIIDMISDDEGPFSPERAGGLPGFQVIKMATSGAYNYKEMMEKVQRQGGLKAYFGTSDTRQVEARISQGDDYARLILEAMAHNVAKNIGKLAVVVRGKVDGIVLTGGIAHSRLITDWITERVSFIAPVTILAGENEMESLALGVLRVLRGEEKARTFTEGREGE